MQGYEIRFNIYAEDENEVSKAKDAIVGFISEQAKNGRAVSASKIIETMNILKNKPLYKMSVNRFLNK